MTSHKVLSDEHGPVPSPPRRPLRMDAERNRQRLLASAQAVFAERGLDASMDDIAAHAGVGIGTAYRRFANKEEVIAALFELRISGMIDLASECAAMPVAWDGLVRFLQETCRAMATDRGFRDVLLREERKQSKLASIRERLTPIMATLVDRAQAAGAVRADFQAMDLPMVILMMEAITDATDRIDPRVTSRYLTLLLGGMHTGPSAELPLPGQPLTSHQTEQAFGRRHTRH